MRSLAFALVIGVLSFYIGLLSGNLAVMWTCAWLAGGNAALFAERGRNAKAR